MLVRLHEMFISGGLGRIYEAATRMTRQKRGAGAFSRAHKVLYNSDRYLLLPGDAAMR